MFTELMLGADPATTGAATSVWGLLLKGGWIMIPIGACSLVAITIIVERALLLRKQRVAPAGLVSSIAGWKSDPRRALDRLASNSAPLAAVLAAGIRGASEDRVTREKMLEEEGYRQVASLKRRLRLLSALPQVSTMLGLLGTVMGMIRTFTVVAASGESLGKTERLAQGIYEAWTATAAGLLVAIPVLIAYHVLLGRVDAAAAAIDRAVLDWLNDERDSAAAPASTPLPAVQVVNTPVSPPVNSNGVAAAIA